MRYLVPTGTTLLVLAILVVVWVMVIRGRRVGLAPPAIVGASLSGVLCGLMGARLFHLLQHLPQSLESPTAWLNLWGGTTSWGAYLAGTLGFSLYLRLRRAPIPPHLDLLASALALGPLVSRWGCLLSGCCFGRPSDLPWAITYPSHSYAYLAHLDAGVIDAAATCSLPVPPVQIYASLAALALWDGKGAGAMVLYPLFAALNQALASLALLVVAVYLHRRHKPVWMVTIPFVFMLVVTAWAMSVNIGLYRTGRQWHLFIIATIVLVLQLWLTVEAVIIWLRIRKERSAAAMAQM